MIDADLVAGLDRDRLLELAQFAMDLQIDSDKCNCDDCTRLQQLAALCRVVAGADNVTDWTVEKAGIAYWVDWRADAQTEPFRTLASALAAVSEEGEKT